jgi:3-oxoacyl-[acyl-carrier-protein] synthase II
MSATASAPLRRRRVAVTGVGLICGLGSTTTEVWDGLVCGRSGIAPITLFDASRHDTRFAGEASGFDPLQFFDRKDLKKAGRFIQFAVAATEMALAQSRLRIADALAPRTGVYVGSGQGAFEIVEREHHTLLERGPSRISPFFIPASLVNLAAGQISIRTGATGPVLCIATACASGANAIGEAGRAIAAGYLDAAICGGAEACITPLSVAGFNAMRALSTRNDEPTRASRPWDADRDGFVIGEGAGILILEPLDAAIERGADVLAELSGYGASSDAYHVTRPPSDGSGAARAMRASLEDAELQPEAVDYVNAHATSTEQGDAAELCALRATFGSHTPRLAISSTKSMTGHLLGGSGALEAGIVVQALLHQVAPPTVNLDRPDDDLDFVPHHARRMNIRHALSNSFGFGGANAALVFTRWPAANQ